MKLRRILIVSLGVTWLAGGCATVESGYVGIKSRLGRILPDELNPGIHFFIPFIENINIVDVRVKKRDFTQENTVTTLTKDGLNVKVDITILYRLDPKYAAETVISYSYFWDDRIIVPALRAAVRDVASTYTASELYQERARFGEKIRESIKDKFAALHVIVEDVLVRNIQIPQKVVQAIEMKIQAQQEAERMKYILEKERLEAERKKVEAKGIAEANRIIAGSLSQKYLQWKYIDALERLVNSPNNTVIILPFGQDMLPIIPLERGK